MRLGSLRSLAKDLGLPLVDGQLLRLGSWLHDGLVEHSARAASVIVAFCRSVGFDLLGCVQNVRRRSLLIKKPR